MQQTTHSNAQPSNQRIADLLHQVFLGLAPQISEEQPLVELTMPQLRALMLINYRGPIRVSDLSTELNVGMPTVTSLVTRLEEKGLAKREHDTHDRRVVFCSLTDHARGELEQFFHLRMDMVHRILDNLSPVEAEHVVEGLECMVEAIRRARGPDGQQNC